MPVFNTREGLGLAERNFRIVLPTAPTRPVACNNNVPTTSWFDMSAIGPTVYENLDAIYNIYN